jgi:hypothetical protein
LLASSLIDGWPGTIAGVAIMIPSAGIIFRGSRTRLAPSYSTAELPSAAPITSAEVMLQAANADGVTALGVAP